LLRIVAQLLNDEIKLFAGESVASLPMSGYGTSVLGNCSLSGLPTESRVHNMVTNRFHALQQRGDAARQIKQGAGGSFAGARAVRVDMGGRLLCAFLCVCASADFSAAADAPPPRAISFAYANSHSVTPLPPSAILAAVNFDGYDSDEPDAFDEPHDTVFDVRVGRPPALSRNGMCSAVVSVARANDLPVPFFANLIWQESSFNTRTISHAGAFGVAQFMPQTANEYGLINPFEPLHALHAAGRFLRKLNGQFGNPGLAAAAYNAGPRRVSDWMAKRGGLPTETRNYVTRITGRQAEQWTSSEFARGPEATLMPAKAPCAEVAEEVAEQGKIVHVARLISELAAATKPPPPPANPAEPKFDEAAWTVATAKAGWKLHALNVIRGALKNISEQKTREAHAKESNKPAGKMATKAGRAWTKIADRTMQKAAQEFAKVPASKPPVEKAGKSTTARGRAATKRTHVASR
jgi:hypothetical protein